MREFNGHLYNVSDLEQFLIIISICGILGLAWRGIFELFWGRDQSLFIEGLAAKYIEHVKSEITPKVDDEERNKYLIEDVAVYFDKLDILMWKCVFKEKVIFLSGSVAIDLSEVVDVSHHDGTTTKMCKLDAIMTNKNYRLKSDQTTSSTLMRLTNSEILTQMTILKCALATLQKAGIKKYDPKFYYGRVALSYVGDYVEYSIKQKDVDCRVRSFLSKFDIDLLKWACVFFNESTVEVKSITLLLQKIMDMEAVNPIESDLKI